jgi:hypothetical protein
MRPWLRAPALGKLALRALLFLAGLDLILRSALKAQGGRPMLWAFAHDSRHRFTAMAMVTGTLRLHSSLSAVEPDEQTYNGAGYTNWGYGVPLLQMPFQAYARARKSFETGFFPDRAIFFIYLALCVPVLWLALDHLLAIRDRPRSALKRDVLSGAATAFLLTYALYPLMSARFFIYEETIAYFVLTELLALSAYLFSLQSGNAVPIGTMGFAAGLGLLIRPTGIIYAGVWGALLLLERRSKKVALWYGAALSPCVAFWLYSNWVKTGSPLAFGYRNGLPWFGYHTAELHFDNYQCADSIQHVSQAAHQLFEWFFVAITDYSSPYLKKCHFDFELRPPDNAPYHGLAFFGSPVLVFLIWTLGHYLVRRERRLAVYVPFVALLALFFKFATTVGFAWRYTGDFWPLFALIAAQYVYTLPIAMTGALGLRLALVFYLAYAGGFKRYIEPAIPTISKLEDYEVAQLPAAFETARWGVDPPLSNRIECGSVPAWPFHNGQGWSSACTVDTYSNVFLGVPKKSDSHYELRFRTQNIDSPTLRVYVNGRIYTARRSGTLYTAAVKIDYAALHAKAVMATVEWTPEFDPPDGRMLAIELV